MKMNRFRNFGFGLSILAAAVAGALPVYASEKGNGGGAFVCLDHEEKVLSAESEDLWMGERHWGLKRPGPDARDEKTIAYEQVEKLKKVNPRFYRQVRAELNKVFEMRRVLSKRIILPIMPDEDYRCPGGLKAEFRQVAIYFDQEPQLVFSKSIFENMSSVDQAALSVHEAIYKVLRDRFGATSTDSERAQKIVAHLFSPQGEPKQAPVPKGCQVNPKNGACEWKLRYEFSSSEGAVLNYFVFLKRDPNDQKKEYYTNDLTLSDESGEGTHIYAYNVTSTADDYSKFRITLLLGDEVIEAWDSGLFPYKLLSRGRKRMNVKRVMGMVKLTVNDSIK
jgi:hypothetical protein